MVPHDKKFIIDVPYSQSVLAIIIHAFQYIFCSSPKSFPVFKNAKCAIFVQLFPRFPQYQEANIQSIVEIKVTTHFCRNVTSTRVSLNYISRESRGMSLCVRTRGPWDMPVDFHNVLFCWQVDAFGHVVIFLVWIHLAGCGCLVSLVSSCSCECIALRRSDCTARSCWEVQGLERSGMSWKEQKAPNSNC